MLRSKTCRQIYTAPVNEKNEGQPDQMTTGDVFGSGSFWHAFNLKRFAFGGVAKVLG